MSKKISIKLTIFLSLNFLLSGCITINFRQPLTPFPQNPKNIEYTKDPIVKYNNDKTYMVTDEMVEKATLDHIYLKEILYWKKENKID